MSRWRLLCRSPPGFIPAAGARHGDRRNLRAGLRYLVSLTPDFRWEMPT